MRAVLQRVSRARVSVHGQEIAAIGAGAVVLLGVDRADSAHDLKWLVHKISRLRIYDDDQGRMNRSIDQVGGEFLVVSQFTLLADCRKGNRPSYISAAAPEDAEAWYKCFVEDLRACGHRVQTGQFQTCMAVELVNDGPVTICLDSVERGAAS